VFSKIRVMSPPPKSGFDLGGGRWLLGGETAVGGQST
jgi:hypothetical protein